MDAGADDERGDDGERNGDRDDSRRAKARQEEENDGDGQKASLDRLVLEGFDGGREAAEVGVGGLDLGDDGFEVGGLVCGIHIYDLRFTICGV